MVECRSHDRAILGATDRSVCRQAHIDSAPKLTVFGIERKNSYLMARVLAAMTAEERERMNWLCLRIQDEKDPKMFDDLVQELYDLLAIKHERIHPEHKTR